MALHIIGVRHHSPACARLVAHAIRTLRPRHVLIEGPADMNGRLDELLLGHELPVALFTFYQSEGRNHASWTPFCRHSPEWIALDAAREVGAQAWFMDLPAWSEAFAGIRNRYGDHPLDVRAEQYIRALCRRFQVDDFDTLWDHLFEQPMPLSELAARLEEFFEGERGEGEADERDSPREAFMARCLSWALADTERHGGDVVAVCGGFHAPALRSPHPRPLSHPHSHPPGEGSPHPGVSEEVHFPPSPGGLGGRVGEGGQGGEVFPAPPAPEVAARHGTYLVPYSFQRLDSFAGYESGMPSPAFYDAVWERGPEDGAALLLRRSVERLRAKRQPVSAADLIACSTLAAGLARMRGHGSPARTDLLDGVAGALVKDSLEAPLPWSYRGTLRPRTDPLLVEVMAAFSGEKAGRLALATPRPPLVDDAVRQLAEHGLTPERVPRTVEVDLTDEAGRTRSRILHRLRVLGIPGFTRLSGPEPATGAELKETWMIEDVFERESALIEAGAWGATLESAATARLEEALLDAGGQLAVLARLLTEAVFVGIAGLGLRVLEQVAKAVHQEPSFAILGQAAGLLLALWRHDVLLGARGARQLGLILEASFDRGLWLVEGLQGPTAPADPEELKGVAALRDLVRFGAGRLAVDGGRAAAVMERRAADSEAPPALRGAAIGFLWSLGLFADEAEAQAQAERAVRSAARPESFGDFLAGLFVLAREEVLHAERLLAAVDAALCGFGQEGFLIALPALRLAFSFFPPLEREAIAQLVLTLHGSDPARAAGMLKLDIPAEEVARGLALESEVARIAARYGLEEEA